MSDLLERLRAALGDRYAIESEVGRGGMAVVFLAEDLKHHRKVALKVLHPELTATLGAERFLQEIEIVAGLQHPHILPLYDSGESDGLLYYVMPFAEGESLRHRLDREGQLAVDEAVRIAVEVADALDYAHRKGVVHRDIKPGNILLSERHAVVADFGIARAIEAARRERITRTGLGLGTPLYASPEQATAEETLDGRTDIYSLACVLYEMLAGEPPLTGSTPQMIQARRLTETPTPLHTVRDTVSPSLDAAISRALTRIPADRYATASQFGQALQSALWADGIALAIDASTTPPRVAAGGRTQSELDGLPNRKGRLRAWILGAIVLAAVVAIGNRVVNTRNGAPPASNQEESVLRSSKLTSTGKITAAAISDDGTKLVYCDQPEAEAGGLRVADLGHPDSAYTLTVTEDCWDVGWVPNDSTILFNGRVMGKWGRYRIPSQGGAVLPSDCRARGLSPDGEWCAFSFLSGGAPALYNPHISLKQTSEKGVEGDLWNYITLPGTYQGVSMPAWSPDGKRLAVGTKDAVRAVTIWTLKSNGTDPKLIVQHAGGYTGLTWAPDGAALYYFRESLAGLDLIRVTLTRSGGAAGSPERLWSTPSSSAAFGLGLVTPSISADGEKMVVVLPDYVSRVVLVVADDKSVETIARPLTAWVPTAGFDISNDGQWIAYKKVSSERVGLYRMNLTEGTEEHVVSAGSIGRFAWSPNGRFLAFSAPWRDTLRLWIVNGAGGDPAMVQSLVVGSSGFAWGSGRLFVGDPDRKNFTIVDELTVVDSVQGRRVSIDSVVPERMNPANDILGVKSPLVANVSLQSHMWGLIPSPDGDYALINWSFSGEPGRYRWLIWLDGSGQIPIVGADTPIGIPIGWTDDHEALYWERDGSVYSALPNGDEKTFVLTLPDTESGMIGGCKPRRGTAGREFLCHEKVFESDAWLIEDFDPHVN